MLLQKDLEDRIKAIEQFVEAKKNEYLMALGRLDEQKELLSLMVAQEKKLLADAAEAEKKTAEEQSAKESQEEGSAAKTSKKKAKADAGMAVQD